MTIGEMRYKLNGLRMMLNDGEHGEEQEILVEIINELDKAESDSKGDLISRQAVKKQIEEWAYGREFEYSNATHYINKRIDSIPSTDNKGEWIIDDDGILTCSKCGAHTLFKTNFCYKCGADMRGSTDE